MSKSTVEDGLSEVLRDGESLRKFIDGMKYFNQSFCDAMASGVDFTIKLEVHGNLGELLHAKVDGGRWYRPKGVERRIEKRKKT